MKKFTKIFAFAMALMMVFALQAPVSAAEKGAGAGNSTGRYIYT